MATVPITVTPAVSGYTRITEFTFTPTITSTDISEKNVVWDFGDGTVIKPDQPATIKHIFNYPGTYTVKLTVFNKNGTAEQNTVTSTIKVKNYIQNALTFNDKKRVIKAGVLSNKNNLLNFKTLITWQDYNPNGNIIWFASDNDEKSGNLSDLYDYTYKYAFLLPFRAFYMYTNNSGYTMLKNNNYKINLYPLRYVLDENNEPRHYTSTDPISSIKILGYKGTGEIYYYDDNVGIKRIFATIDTSNHQLPDFYANNINLNINSSGKPYMETATSYLDVCMIADKPTKLVLTSTGNKHMSVENYGGLYSYKRQGDPFRIFVGAGDKNGNIYKFFDKFTLSETKFDNGEPGSFKVSITKYSDTYNLSGTTEGISCISTNKFPYNNSLSSSDLSSFFYFNYNPVEEGTFTINVSGKPYMNSDVLSGSYTFTVLPSAENNFYKINELEFDHAETIKSYRFQEFLHQYEDLFDGILGTIVGTLSSNPNTYGKSVYEKISNFVSNHSDADTCSLNALKGLYDLLNNKDTFVSITPPPEMKRLMDLFSIRYRRLMGMQEKNNLDFNTKYNTGSEYNKNIDTSNPINSSTYIVSAGTPFVAIQKFNHVPIMIHPQKVATSTLQSSGSAYFTESETTSTYPLSDFNKISNWGWPLDYTSTGDNLSLIYDFYPYIDLYTNTIKNNTLDFNYTYEHNKTKRVGSLPKWEVLMFKEFDYQLRKGLNL